MATDLGAVHLSLSSLEHATIFLCVHSSVDETRKRVVACVVAEAVSEAYAFHDDGGDTEETAIET